MVTKKFVILFVQVYNLNLFPFYRLLLISNLYFVHTFDSSHTSRFNLLCYFFYLKKQKLFYFKVSLFVIASKAV